VSDREIVSRKALNEWLTEYVSSHEDCEGTSVRVQQKLRSPDSDGCNWSDSVICNLGPNADDSVAMKLVSKAVREARGKFNLDDAA
jgi:hypothetical protein